MDFRPLLNLRSDRIRALPLVVLYITDGCNSRCVTCDIWKLPRRNMAMTMVEKLAAEFPQLGVRQVVLSGGEAMQHPEWPRIAARFRASGARVNLLTNGLFLRKQAAEVAALVDQLTVSLDGGTPETYAAIRGVDGFDAIQDGMRLAAAAGVPITTRTTIQRANFRELDRVIDAAKEGGANKISFLAVDVSNREAFGPRTVPKSGFPVDPALVMMNHAPPSPALTADELPEFAAMLDKLEQDYAEDFASSLIAETPAKLRRLYTYFAALHGLARFEPPRCNAPHLSTVIGVDGALQPCFFLPSVGNLRESTLAEALNGPGLVAERFAYRTGARAECERCVCPLYQGPRTLLRDALRG